MVGLDLAVEVVDGHDPHLLVGQPEALEHRDRGGRSGVEAGDVDGVAERQLHL